MPRGHHQRLHLMRAPTRRDTKMKPKQKESSKTEGQKATSINFKQKPLYIVIKSTLTIYKINKTHIAKNLPWLYAKKIKKATKSTKKSKKQKIKKKSYKTTKTLSTLNHSYHSPSSQDYLKSRGPKPNQQ